MNSYDEIHDELVDALDLDEIFDEWDILPAPKDTFINYLYSKADEWAVDNCLEWAQMNGDEWMKCQKEVLLLRSFEYSAG